MISPPNGPNLESLTDLATRTGVDIRPTLLRVLTDLYVQKPAHTPEEVRSYVELALRLIDDVDLATKATVAVRLARYHAAPAAVLSHLARELPELAGSTAERPVPPANADLPPITPPADRVAKAGSDARELNDLFFAATSAERRLILLNLEFVAPLEPRPATARDRIACHLLEAAALARKTDDFVQQLVRSLPIAREQALRIVRDDSGEPVVAAAKALRMPSAVLHRILLFLNPAIGHSVERVHTLAKLYDEITTEAAGQLVAIWRKARPTRQPSSGHLPLHWNDEASRARPAATLETRRSSHAANQATAERRRTS